MRRNLRSTDSFCFLYCRDKHLELLLATIRLLEDKVKKVTKRYVCLLFPLEYTWTFILGETNCWFRGEEIGVYSIGWF